MEIEADKSSVLHMKLLQRANEIPLVKSAASYVSTCYQQAKDYNGILNSTLNMAENGAKLAGRAVTPVVTQLDGNINRVDNIACQALNVLENRYPSIKMETEEVSSCLANATADVRGGAEKYAGALLQSAPGQLALRIANKVTDITLPEDKSDSSNLALQDVAELSDKLHGRLSILQLQLLQETSTKALIGLQSHLAALECVMKANLEKYGVKDQTEKLWQQLQNTTHSMHQPALVAAGELSQQLCDGTSAVTDQILQLAHQVSAQLVSMYAEAAKSSTNLPATVQTAIQKSQSHTKKLHLQLSQVKTTDDLTATVLSQIRETMTLFQCSISHILLAASSQPLDQKTPAVSPNPTERVQTYMKAIQKETEFADIEDIYI